MMWLRNDFLDNYSLKNFPTILDIDLKTASKFFAGKFSCGSSISGEDEIVIQGDVKDDMFDILPEKWKAVRQKSLYAYSIYNYDILFYG